MTRGNQRELARQKNQKKLQELNKKKGVDDKGANSGMTLEQRRQRDADRLREKQLAKQQQSSTGSDANKKG